MEELAESEPRFSKLTGVPLVFAACAWVSILFALAAAFFLCEPIFFEGGMVLYFTPWDYPIAKFFLVAGTLGTGAFTFGAVATGGRALYRIRAAPKDLRGRGLAIGGVLLALPPLAVVFTPFVLLFLLVVFVALYTALVGPIHSGH